MDNKAPFCIDDEPEPDYDLDDDDELDIYNPYPDRTPTAVPAPEPRPPDSPLKTPDTASASSRDPLVPTESLAQKGRTDSDPLTPVRRSLTDATILTSTEYLSSDVESLPSVDPTACSSPEFAAVKPKKHVTHEVISELPHPKLDTGTSGQNTGQTRFVKRKKGGFRAPGHHRLSAEQARVRRTKEVEQEIADDLADDPEFGESLNEMIQQQQARRSMRHAKHRKSRRWSKRSSGRSVSSEGSGSQRDPDRQGSIVDIYCRPDESTNKAELKENIKLQKDIISNIRTQPWRMKRKLRTLRLAKSYVERYEGRLSRSRGYQEAGAKFWRKCKRIAKNFSAFFIPWEMRIKKIESHFGSVVSSYFTFLRWLVWVNILLAVITMCFIVIPEILVGKPHGTTPSKSIPDDERDEARNLNNIIDFEGYLKYSVLFYGFYGNEETIGRGYRLPLAYFLAGLATFAISFIIILRRMAKNSRLGRMASKDEQYVFSWRVFASWDFMIGNFETSKNKAAENVTIFRESIFEEEEKKKTENKKVLLLLRVVANFLVMIVLASSCYAITLVVNRSIEFEDKLKRGESVSWYERNEVSIIMSLITALYPTIFDLIGLMEKYHPRINLRWQLTRILILYLLNLYTLIIALYNKIKDQQVLVMQFTAPNVTCTYPVYNINPPTMNTTDPLLPLVFQSQSAILSSTHDASTPFQDNITVFNVTASFNFTDFDLMNGTFKTIMESNTTLWHNFTDSILKTTSQTTPGSESVVSTVLTGSTTEDVTQTVPGRNCSGLSDQRPEDSCWETMLGQEIMKLALFDTVIAVAMIMLIDFVRGLWVRYCSGWWCWDLESKFPEYGEFKIAENILHLIYNQATIWMGTFFSPVLPTANILKLLILLYVRSWAVLMCNIPHERVFKASKSNNFYFALLLLMLFLVTLPVMYLLVMVQPSVHCGPFRGLEKSYYIFTDTIEKEFPAWLNTILDYVASPGVILPLFLLMVMAIFYMISLSRSYKMANRDLLIQLHLERTEEKRKIYAMADARAKGSIKAAAAAADGVISSLKLSQVSPSIKERVSSQKVRPSSNRDSLADITDELGSDVQQYQKGNIKVVRVPTLTQEQAVAIKSRKPNVKIITASEARVRGLIPADHENDGFKESSASGQEDRTASHITQPVAAVQGKPAAVPSPLASVVMSALKSSKQSKS